MNTSFPETAPGCSRRFEKWLDKTGVLQLWVVVTQANGWEDWIFRCNPMFQPIQFCISKQLYLPSLCLWCSEFVNIIFAFPKPKPIEIDCFFGLIPPVEDSSHGLPARPEPRDEQEQIDKPHSGSLWFVWGAAPMMQGRLATDSKGTLAEPFVFLDLFKPI